MVRAQISGGFRPFPVLRPLSLALGLVLGLPVLGLSALPSPTLAGPTPADGPPAQTDITGEFLAPDVLCPRFRLIDGEEISLDSLPSDPALRPGARLRLTGRFLRVSRCLQGRAFDVRNLTHLP